MKNNMPDFPTSKKIRLTQVVSAASRNKNQAVALKGLGLRRIGSTKVLENTPDIRGIIWRVKHLIKVVAE